MRRSATVSPGSDSPRFHFFLVVSWFFHRLLLTYRFCSIIVMVKCSVQFAFLSFCRWFKHLSKHANYTSDKGAASASTSQLRPRGVTSHMSTSQSMQSHLSSISTPNGANSAQREPLVRPLLTVFSPCSWFGPRGQEEFKCGRLEGGSSVATCARTCLADSDCTDAGSGGGRGAGGGSRLPDRLARRVAAGSSCSGTGRGKQRGRSRGSGYAARRSDVVE